MVDAKWETFNHATPRNPMIRSHDVAARKNVERLNVSHLASTISASGNSSRVDGIAVCRTSGPGRGCAPLSGERPRAVDDVGRELVQQHAAVDAMRAQIALDAQKRLVPFGRGRHGCRGERRTRLRARRTPPKHRLNAMRPG